MLSSFVVSGDNLKDTLFIVTPYAEGKDMRAWINPEIPGEMPLYPPDMDKYQARTDFILFSIASLCEALAYLHAKLEDQWCGHFDIKPGNILLFQENGSWIWKLSDFGSSKLKHSSDQGTTQNIGTDKYWPPEYENSPAGTKFGPSFDAWSIGCTFLELLTIQVHAWSSEGAPSHTDSEGKARTNIVFRTPFMVQEWVQRLEKLAYDPRSIDALRTVQAMLDHEIRHRLYAFYAAIRFLKPAYPEMSQSDFEGKCGKIIMGQNPSPSFGQFYDPTVRVRTDFKNPDDVGILVRCFKEAGWPTRPGLSPGRNSEHSRLPNTIRAELTTLPLRYQEDHLHGREALLQTITSNFAYSSIIALVGLSGIGKSHLAWTYAWNTTNSAKAAGSSVQTFWIQCRNESALRSSYEDIAKIAGLPFTGNSNAKLLLRGVERWLRGLDRRSIIILDGVEDSKAEWLKWIPLQQGLEQNIKWLITTKSKQVGRDLCSQPHNIIEVGSLEVKEGVNLFLQWSGSIEHDDREQAKILVGKLHLPILIKLIARAINHHKNGGKTISKFARELSSSKNLIEELSSLESRDLRSKESQITKRIYQMIFKRLLKKSPGIETEQYQVIFKVVCFLPSDNIDRTCLEREFGETVVQRAFSFFVDYGYMKLNGSCYGSQYVTHELVQNLYKACMRHRSSDIKRDFWAAHRRALWMTFNDYVSKREVQIPVETDSGDIVEIRQTPRSLLKLRYQDQVEEFLKYVDCYNTHSLKFRKDSAHALITFARTFDSEGRNSIAQRILRYVVAQGIENDLNYKTELHARRDLIHSLTTSASGRTKWQQLSGAHEEASKSLKQALASEDWVSIWKMRRECFYLFCAMEDNILAKDELESMRVVFNNLKNKDAARQELYECEARYAEAHAYKEKTPQSFEEARMSWDRCYVSLSNSLEAKFDVKLVEKQQRARRRFADMQLRKMDSLGLFAILDGPTREQGKLLGKKACQIYWKQYQDLEKDYSAEARKFGLHKHVIDARRDADVARLRCLLWETQPVEKQITGLINQVDALYNDLEDYQKAELDILNSDVKDTAYVLREGLFVLSQHQRKHQYKQLVTRNWSLELIEHEKKYDLSSNGQQLQDLREE